MYGISTYVAGSIVGSMLVNIPYMEHMGVDVEFFTYSRSYFEKMETYGRYAKSTPIVPGWWYTYPSEKYGFVSWENQIPN